MPMPSSLDRADRETVPQLIDRVAGRGSSAIPRLEARIEGDMFPPPSGETRRADDPVEEIGRSGILAQTGLSTAVGQGA